MAKTKISQYDATAANNTDIDSISIAEGMAPSNVNNAIRELMAHLKDMDAGTQALTSPQLTSVDINGGTIDGAVIGANSAAAITGTTITGTSLVIGDANINENDFESIDGITAGTVAASKAVIVDANKDVTGFRNVTLTGELDAGSLDVSGDIDVDGVTNLDVVDIDGAVDMASTLGVTGKITADAGIDIDNINIDGTTIALSSGDLTVDVAGDIIFDADGGDFLFRDNANNEMTIKVNDGSNIDFTSHNADHDIRFRGVDGSSTITALTLDMSDAGAATFNSGATFGGSGRFDNSASTPVRLHINNSGSNDYASIYADTASAYKNLILNQSGGNVGIGTTPDQLLTVGNTSTQYTRLQFYAATNGASTIHFGDGSSAAAYRGYINYAHDSDSLQFATSATERMRINSSGNVGIGTASPNTYSGQTALTINSTGVARLDLDVSDTLEGYLISESGYVGLFAKSGGSVRFGNASERARIDSSGRMLVGLTSASGDASAKLQARGTGASAAVFDRTTDGVVVGFKRNGGNDVGNISITSSNTAYNTSSDYRLKENVDYSWDATTRLKQLKPARFNFIVDDTNTLVDGFLAHEVSSIVPEAITGAKDAVDADGNPEYQGIDQSKLVPLLVKTIQELEARITTLEG
tara:strand:- start:2887 stop:4812 length:1926 start_codon:yes stop_codon:yes gene_type:complete